MVEDRGPVLRADIVALAVERGRIMNGEEDLEQVAIRHDLWVKRDLYRLGMAGAARAYRLVGGIRHTSPDVAGLDRRDAFQLVVHRFQTPKTSAGQRGDFHS